MLFSAHMVMHMVVAMLVPLLLVPAAPLTLALRALPARPDKTWGPREVILQLVHSRYLGALANPVVAAALFFFSLAIFYYSPLFELALSTHTGHVAMMVHFLLSGYLFVWVLIGIDPGPKRWSPLLLIVILFATMAFHAFFGVIMTGGTTLLAPDFFSRLDLAWVPDPLADQQRAGAIAWGVGEARRWRWPCWWRQHGCVLTGRRPSGATARPTVTGMQSSRPTTHNWRSVARPMSRPSAPGRSGLRAGPRAARETMEADMRVAVIQVAYGDDEPMKERVERVAGLVRQQQGHDLVVLPELWAPGGFAYRDWDERAEPVDGPTSQAMADAARDAGVMLHAGSIVERPGDGETGPEGRGLWNTSLVFTADGELAATYRKIHRFGFGSGEPKLMDAGEDIVLVDLPGGQGRAGLSTCYDLRFPELYRRQLDAGATAFLVPAAWPMAGSGTGPSWHTRGPSRTSAS